MKTVQRNTQSKASETPRIQVDSRKDGKVSRGEGRQVNFSKKDIKK